MEQGKTNRSEHAMQNNILEQFNFKRGKICNCVLFFFFSSLFLQLMSHYSIVALCIVTLPKTEAMLSLKFWLIGCVPNFENNFLIYGRWNIRNDSITISDNKIGAQELYKWVFRNQFSCLGAEKRRFVIAMLAWKTLYQAKKDWLRFLKADLRWGGVEGW